MTTVNDVCKAVLGVLESYKPTEVKATTQMRILEVVRICTDVIEGSSMDAWTMPDYFVSMKLSDQQIEAWKFVNDYEGRNSFVLSLQARLHGGLPLTKTQLDALLRPAAYWQVEALTKAGMDEESAKNLNSMQATLALETMKGKKS